MKIYPVEMLHIAQVRLDPDNVFRHSDQQQQRLVGVIGEHGNLSVICVDAGSKKIEQIDIGKGPEKLPTYELVGGEARLEAYRANHAEMVPAIMAEFATPEQRKAAALALNASFGDFDEEALDALLHQLAEASYDLDMTGLEPFRYEAILQEGAPSLDDLEHQYGQADDSLGWPKIELVVPPETKEQYDRLLAEQDGESDHERFASLLLAASEYEAARA